MNSMMTVGALFIRANPRDETSGRWVTGKDGFVAITDENATLPFLVIAQATVDQKNRERALRQQKELSLDEIGLIQKLVIAGVERPNEEREWSSIFVGRVELEKLPASSANSSPVIGANFVVKRKSRGIIHICTEVRAT